MAVEVFTAVVKSDEVGRIEMQLPGIHTDSERLSAILQGLAPILFEIYAYYLLRPVSWAAGLSSTYTSDHANLTPLLPSSIWEFFPIDFARIQTLFFILERADKSTNRYPGDGFGFT
jgi:hypothetical protein